MNVIKEFWANNHKADHHEFSWGAHTYTQCPRIECTDGFTMSVQASHTHYCLPRTYIADGDYASWEIGFPSAKEELIMPYVEDADQPNDTVYRYVRTEGINEFIAKHGGIANAKAVA